MAFDNLKGKRFTVVTSSAGIQTKEIYRKTPAVLRLGKKEKTQGGFFDYGLILSASDQSLSSSEFTDESVIVQVDSASNEVGVYLTASLFRNNMNEFLQNTAGFNSSSYAQISASFFSQIGDATTNMPAGDAYIGILASPFESGSVGSGSAIIAPVTASFKVSEAPGIAFDSASQLRTRKVTYLNTSSNFTNSHFFFNFRRSDSTTAKFGDTEQSASSAALTSTGKPHLTRSFTSIFTSPKSAQMFYYVQAQPVREWSLEMTSSAGTASFYALTSSFSSSADFGVVSGGLANSASSFAGNSIETSSASHPKFYNGHDDSDGEWTYVVQKGVIEGEGEFSLGEEQYGGDNGANFAFTPQQLLVWYTPEYYYSNVRSASYYFTPYPENMHELNTGNATRDLITGSISSSEAIGTGELRTLYWLNHTFTSSFTGSFGNHTRAQLKNRVGEANNLQLPYMNTHKIGTANSYFGRKQREANSSHLWKDKYLSVPADMGYYVHSGSFLQASKNQMTSSVESGGSGDSHTGSFFVMGVFKHPFVQAIDGTIMNYSASQEREVGVTANSWINHHPIASCMFLKRYDDQVFVYHASASGKVVSESVGS